MRVHASSLPPLHFALMREHARVPELLAAGADPSAAAADSLTPLMRAAAFAPELVPTIARASGPGAVFAQDARGFTALHWAAHKGRVESFESLLAAGANINALNHAHKTPLALAVHKGLAPVEALLNLGANPSLRSKGASPLLAALRANQPAIVRVLLAAGALADEHTKNGRGQSALHLAVEYCPSAVEPLLAAGCATRVLNSRGQTPMAVALRNARHLEIVLPLLRAGLAEPWMDAFMEPRRSEKGPGLGMIWNTWRLELATGAPVATRHRSRF